MTKAFSIKDGVYVFGEKSKAANWILNHFHFIIGGCLLPFAIAYVGNTVMLGRILQIELFMLVLAFLFRFITKNLCYKVAIDTINEKIKFYRCFNKGIVEAPVRSVEFRFDRIFACHYDGERFAIFPEYMCEISEMLPQGVEIHFPTGWRGRRVKRVYEQKIEKLRDRKKGAAPYI